MEALRLRLQAALRNRFLRYGFPFVSLLVGGSFGLQHFASLRYETSRKKMITPDEAEKLGVQMKTDGVTSIEREYEKLQSRDIDTWTNIRGPRPWENSKEIQDRQRKDITEASMKS